MTKKKDSMQTKVEKSEGTGEQLDLIDVKPENAKPIIAAARLYKKLMGVRQKALAKEVVQKAEVLRLIKAAELQPLAGGKIKFEYDSVIISVTPRDELITVKDKDYEED